MEVCKTILETIGNTPLVQINNITKDIPGTFLIKVETFNPGHSIKDRMALKMVEDAEKVGLLQKGGTIIECTSGNTGMGLALAASVKGYRCIFTTTDKQSKEKIDILNIDEIKQIISNNLSNFKEIKLEYFVIADEQNLKPIKYKPTGKYRAFIAAYVSGVRLIDNIKLY